MEQNIYFTNNAEKLAFLKDKGFLYCTNGPERFPSHAATELHKEEVSTMNGHKSYVRVYSWFLAPDLLFSWMLI